MYSILLLLVPLAVAASSEHSGYRINIRLTPPGSLIYITIRGGDDTYLSEKDMAMFNLTKENIVKVIEKTSVEKPENVFLRSPADVPNLYESHDFKEVKRDFYLRNNHHFVNVTSEEVNRGVKEYTNNGTKKKQFAGNFSGDYLDFLSKHYYKKKQVPATMRYEIETPTKAPNNYSYYLPIGQDDDVRQGVDKVKLITISAKFDLNPGQTVKFIVNATKVITYLLFEYETTIKGDVVVQSGTQYKAYDIWRILLLNFDLSRFILKSKEFINIQYVSGYTLRIVDIATGKDIPFTDFKYTDM